MALAPQTFETRTITQQPLATTVSPEAFVSIQAADGPVQKLAIKQLLGRLIQTEDIYLTEAAILADLDWDANTVSLVIADAAPAKNGWYRKSGASGAGSWTQFEKLSSQAISEVQAAIDANADAVADAVAAAATVTGALDAISKAYEHTAYVYSVLPFYDQLNNQRIAAGLTIADYPVSQHGIPAPARDEEGVPAIFAYRPAQGLYWFGQRQCRDQAAWLAASSGVITGNVLVNGPFEAPVPINLVTNAAFLNTAGWASTGALDVAATDGSIGTGTLKFTPANASGQDAYWQVPNSVGTGFRFTAEIRKGTGSTAVGLSASETASLNAFNSAQTNSTAFVEYTVEGVAIAGNIFAGMQISGTPAAGGTYFLRNPKIYYRLPFYGFTQRDFTVVMEFPAPGAPSGTKVLLAGDSNSDRDWLKVQREADGHIWIRAKVFNTTAGAIAWDRGAVPDSETIRVAVSAKSGAVQIAINDGPAYTQGGTKIVVPMLRLRWGGDLAGNAYGALPLRAELLAGGRSGVWLQHANIPPSAVTWLGYGDSGLAGALVGGSTVTILDNIRTTRKIISHGVGGSNREEQIAAQTATRYMRSRKRPVFWFNYGPGTEGGYAEQIVQIDEFVKNVGHPYWLIGRAVAVDTASAELVQLQVDLRDYVVNTYGAIHSWDCLPILNSLSDGSPAALAAIAAGKPPPNALAPHPDNTHFLLTTCAELYLDTTAGLGRGLSQAMAAIEATMPL